MEPFHGERIVDGDASTLTILLLYKSGSLTAYTLGAAEVLHITHVTILTEIGGDVALIAAATAAAGTYIVEGSIAAQGGIDKNLSCSPYVCPPGVTPYFSGPSDSGKHTCIIEGYITAA